MLEETERGLTYNNLLYCGPFAPDKGRKRGQVANFRIYQQPERFMLSKHSKVCLTPKNITISRQRHEEVDKCEDKQYEYAPETVLTKERNPAQLRDQVGS